MHNDPYIGLIFITVLIIGVYCIGVWAGRKLERAIVEDQKAEEAKKAEEANKRKIVRRR